MGGKTLTKSDSKGHGVENASGFISSTLSGSHYVVSDLEALAQDTHKFDSRYLDWLFGAYAEKRDSYLARSPINHAERLAVPVIFFQGDEDQIVSPNQTEKMADAIRAKGLPVGCSPANSRAFARPKTSSAH